MLIYVCGINYAMQRSIIKVLYITICRYYAGLKPAVFAALVPNSANKPLIDVAEEIMGDHEMMVNIFKLFSFQLLINSIQMSGCSHN